MAEGYKPKYMDGAEEDLLATAKTNVSINVQSLHKIGNWIYGYAQITVSNALSIFDPMLDLGATAKYKWHGCLLTQSGNLIANKGVYIDASTSVLKAGNSIDAGIYTVQLMIYG